MDEDDGKICMKVQLNQIFDKSKVFFKNERNRNLLFNGILNGVVKISASGLNLLIVPLTLSYLGQERYGLWVTISSFMLFVSFADLGLGLGLINEVAKFSVSNNKKDFKIAVSSSFYVLIYLCVLITIIFGIIYFTTDWQNLLNLESYSAKNELNLSLIIFYFILLSNIPLSVIPRIYEGFQKGYMFQKWSILGSFVSFIAILLCIFFEGSLPWLIFCSNCGQFFAFFMSGKILFFKTNRYLKPQYKYFRLDVSKRILKKGFTFFLLTLFSLIANSSDNIIIAKNIGISYVAEYDILKRVFMFSMFTAFFIQPLWPAFGNALASGDLKWAKKTMNKAILISTFSSSIIMLPLLFFGNDIIKLWLGPKFEFSFWFLFGFYVYIIINNFIGVMSTLLNSSEIASKQILPLLFTSIFSVFFKVLFSAKFGLVGIIWGTTLSWTIFYLIPSKIISQNIFKKKYI